MFDMNTELLHNNLAKYYDRIYSFKDYLDEAVRIQNLIIKYSESAGNSLLDVACGTGLHIKHLKDDFSCTGVDVSKAMLKIARKNVKGVTFKEGDMRSLRLGKQFDVIVCLLSSIGYVKTATRLKQTIQNFSKHLKKGGLALIEPSHAKSAYVSGEPRITTYDGKEVKIARVNWTNFRQTTAGIVYKLDHILDVRDTRLKDEVKLMAPGSDEVQVNNLENTLEAAMALNYIYKVVRHYYIQGKKTLSLYIIMQLQMILPLVMKEAEAYASALKAFAYGQPIGDGAGPLVAAKLMHGYETRKVPKDCVVASVPIEGRNAFIIKAEGPGGNVGKPGDAVKTVVEENKGKIASVMMIDAGLKLEGETVGEVAEGIGAAIGGPGVDQYKIEEAVVEYHIPINAVIVKEDIGDAVSPMRKEIADSADKVIDRVKNVILERTKEGDNIIIVGVGNTIGIGQ